MIADVHTHIGEDKDGTKQSVAQLKKNMKKEGVSKSVIFPFNEPTKDLMRASIDLVEYRNGAIYPFLRFDPKRHKPENVRKALREYEFSGVKLHPFSQNFDPSNKRYNPFYKVIEDECVPLLFHTLGDMDRTKPYKIASLGSRFKDLTIILAHFAGYSGRAIAEVGKRDNLYVETSVISTPRVIEMVSENIGADKIIFGSDSPYSDPMLEIHTIKRAKIRSKDKEKILYKNFIKVLGL
ncbi:MAG: amidohydrolase family protein [Candidatus Micrarchaeota archaeon]|nr:amidohydrolase family protein [Candidatus Micrarchaeota archaeon]MDE1849923.1 amidohydrolase family protein [Candidatus Micrarchaeota archaeon]